MAKLKDCLHYSPDTGLFHWLVRRGSAVAGQQAGCVNALGYWVIRWQGKLELAHRLAWLYSHGEWPEAELDHVNGDVADNRLMNLRPASHSENSLNRKVHRDNQSGFKGVAFHGQSRRWRARIMIGGSSKSLGLYDSPELAHQAYCFAAAQLHGDFARFQ